MTGTLPLVTLRAVIFDLDDTLLDTSALRDDRDARDWGRVTSRLSEATAFDVAGGQPAVTDLPQLFRDRGLAVGLLTQSPRNYAIELLRMHGMRVTAMVTGSDGYAPKPDPKGLLAVASDLGVEPAEAIYVGDSVGDFGAAASAGAVSVGVAWGELTPAAWRHGWPDHAVSRPSRLLEIIDGASDLAPWGEVMADGAAPRRHYGSLLRLGNRTFGLGRYFPTTDRRYPNHALSHLVLAAKDDPDAAKQVANVFSSIAAVTQTVAPPDLIMSVPPSPDGNGYDRFELVRAALAECYDARDGGGLLSMRFGLDDYKHVDRDTRIGLNDERFACEQLAGETVLLIDDVLTSGGQSEACREAISDAGGGSVTVLVLAVTQDRLPEPCPLCGANLKTFKRHRDGHEFLGCTAWWTTGCRYTRNV